jgi:hypothetical protein
MGLQNFTEQFCGDLGSMAGIVLRVWKILLVAFLT